MQTAIKERPIIFSSSMVRAILKDRKTQTRRVITPQPKEYVVDDILQPNIFYIDGDPSKVIKPLYQPGDLLYVREAFGYYPASLPEEKNVIYKADDHVERIKDLTVWRPSIHMPKWAARIWLEVTGVRVERVQDINGQGHHDDVLKEGYPFDLPMWQEPPVKMFERIWNSINEKRGYGWNVNPWVWVIEFKKVER